jgi:uncharacterized protein (TIGR00299 family) protein
LKIVLIDGSMAGVSGDKMLSAFVGAGVDARKIEGEISKALRSIGVKTGGVKFQTAESCGIQGTRMIAELGTTTMGAEGLVKAVGVAGRAVGLGAWGREVAKKALEELVGAEVEIHGSVHLHELGEADTVVDLIGTVKAAELIGLEGAEFYTTPVAVGCGLVVSRHGTLPVPAPATLKILQKHGFAITTTNQSGELSTPTGAALVAALTKGKQDTPPFVVEREGTGIGSMILRVPNITRVLLGDTQHGYERLKVLETNLDDVSGEVLGLFIEKLQGSVEDIAIIPMTTKKNRPGFSVRVVVKPEGVEEAIKAMVKETGTLGVKIFDCQRYKAKRKIASEKVRIRGRGYPVRIKRSGEEGKRIKPEYEDLRAIALSEEMSLKDVSDEVMLQVRQKYAKEGRDHW